MLVPYCLSKKGARGSGELSKARILPPPVRAGTSQISRLCPVSLGKRVLRNTLALSAEPCPLKRSPFSFFSQLTALRGVWNGQSPATKMQPSTNRHDAETIFV